MYRACFSLTTASDCHSQQLTEWKSIAQCVTALSQSASHSMKLKFFDVLWCRGFFIPLFEVFDLLFIRTVETCTDTNF